MLLKFIKILSSKNNILDILDTFIRNFQDLWDLLKNFAGTVIFIGKSKFDLAV